jgi:hypothetical protein
MRVQIPYCVLYRMRAGMPFKGKSLCVPFTSPNHGYGSKIKVDAIYLFFSYYYYYYYYFCDKQSEAKK